MRRFLRRTGLAIAAVSLVGFAVSLVWLVEYHSPRGPFGGIYAGRVTFGLAPPYTKGWLVMRDPGHFKPWFSYTTGYKWWIVGVPMWVPIAAGLGLAFAARRARRTDSVTVATPMSLADAA
ncbi:MAG: hypothetical protein ACKVW3_01345 [Phycisphaerales bacterium]